MVVAFLKKLAIMIVTGVPMGAPLSTTRKMLYEFGGAEVRVTMVIFAIVLCKP